MPNIRQELTDLIAQGKIEAAINILVRQTKGMGDADLRQQILNLSGQFVLLKKQHLTGLLEDKDYRLQLNRITAAVAEIVENDSDSLRPVKSPTSSNVDFWKKLGYVGLIVGILAGLVKIVEYVQKPKPAPIEKPTVEPPKKDTVLVPIPVNSPEAKAKNNVKIELRDKAKVGNIITGDSNKIDIKQDF